MDNYFNRERDTERLKLAAELWRAPYAQLLRYGISSYREITKLDRIGIPVWTSCRPLARTISINAGKSDNNLMSFAGAITEAMEFWAAENPWGPSVLASHLDLKAREEAELLPFTEYPLARASLCDELMQISWEQLHRLEPGNLTAAQAWLPSDCVWLEQRVPTQFVNFAASSNGLASGVRDADAVLSALYELVERDAWTLWQCLIETTGQWPTKVPLAGLPPELESLIEAIRRTGVYPFLFDVTNDLGIPVFGCTLFDPADDGGLGTFGGYGCNLNPVLAAKRAILESAQSRLCYISAARDDMYRRDFVLLKKTEQKKARVTAESLPALSTWNEHVANYWTARGFESIAEELDAVVSFLAERGIRKIYWRSLCEESFGQAKLVVVRVIAPEIEGIKFDHWASNGRAIRFLRKQAA